MAAENTVWFLRSVCGWYNIQNMWLFFFCIQICERTWRVSADYDYGTIYVEIFGGRNGYITNKQMILKEVRNFDGGLEHVEK